MVSLSAFLSMIFLSLLCSKIFFDNKKILYIIDLFIFIFSCYFAIEYTLESNFIIVFIWVMNIIVYGYSLLKYMDDIWFT